MSEKATIEDVRRALWRAYEIERIARGDLGGKSSEGTCTVEYPTVWEHHDDGLLGDMPLGFAEPIGLMVYSYALGPSRQHYFHRAAEESHPNYYTWYAPDIFAKAVEVINGWAKDRAGDGLVTP